MRIVDRKTFLSLPSGTVYMEYHPQNFGYLSIKLNTTREWSEDSAGDFNCDCLLNIKNTGSGDMSDTYDLAEKTGISIPMDYRYTGRDGSYNNDQLYAVLEPVDLGGLVERIREEFATMSKGFAEVFPLKPFEDDIQLALMLFPVYDDDNNRILPGQLQPMWEYMTRSKRTFRIKYITTDGCQVLDTKEFKLDEALRKLLEMHKAGEIAQGLTVQYQ